MKPPARNTPNNNFDPARHSKILPTVLDLEKISLTLCMVLFFSAPVKTVVIPTANNAQKAFLFIMVGSPSTEICAWLSNYAARALNCVDRCTGVVLTFRTNVVDQTPNRGRHFSRSSVRREDELTCCYKRNLF